MKLSENYQSRQNQFEQTAPTQSADRGRLRTVANNVILHLHPAKAPTKALRFSYTWGLVVFSTFLTVILIVIGVEGEAAELGYGRSKTGVNSN